MTTFANLIYKRTDGHINVSPNNKGYYAKYTTLIGDTINTLFSITPGFDTEVIVTQVFEVSTGQLVFPDIVTDTVAVPGYPLIKITFNTIPTTNQYRVVAIGY